MVDYEAIIKSRTSKIVGGYITENEFQNRFNKNGTKESSSVWWASVENSKTNALTYFVVCNELSELDKKIYKILTGSGVQCRQIIRYSEEWLIKDIETEMTRSIDQYVRDHKLNSLHDGIKYSGTKHPEDSSMTGCLDYFRKHNLLMKIARSIELEDLFLNRYFYTTNVDLFLEGKNGAPVCLEIKFKNEFMHTDESGRKLLVFGVDEFQYNNVFIPMLKAGIKVEVCLLYNDIKNEQNTSTTNIISFLEEKRDPLIWKYREITLEDAFERFNVSQRYTSWRGENERVVYCLPLVDFMDLSVHGDSRSWGRCPLGGGKRVIRNSQNGNQFMGCTCYSKHPK